MLRLMFSKTSNAVWISHLDTMRLFQRAFKRSGFHLKHTQGFNPRPSVSIALPLSVGVESNCEILDFELEDENIDCLEVLDKLNTNLIDGVRVLSVYENGANIKNLKFLQCEIDLHYNSNIANDTVSAISALFDRSELWMDKKSKNGIISQNIIPMIHGLCINLVNERILRMTAVIACREPSLNPSQLSAAVEKYAPELAPSFVRCRRCELFDVENRIFR